MIMQVNFLANALLLFELLPLLESGPRPSRVTWVGSKTYHRSTLHKAMPLHPSLLG